MNIIQNCIGVLAKSHVDFDEMEHKYTYKGKEMSGITSLLHRTVFRDMYKDVPEFVLNRAADRGSNIHYEVSLYLNTGIEPASPEGVNFVEKIMPQIGDIVASEYLVTDFKDYASAVDVVCSGKSDLEFELYDIKSTKSGLKKDYVSWQLSCYAFMFELMNPGLSVSRLAGIWLTGDKAEVIDVERIPNETIVKLFEADSSGLPFECDVPTTAFSPETEAMARYRSFEEEFIKLDARIKELKKLKETALEDVMVSMQENNLTSVETDTMKFTLVGETTKSTFDSTKFKADHPEEYAKYMKDTTVKAYVKATIKK